VEQEGDQDHTFIELLSGSITWLEFDTRLSTNKLPFFYSPRMEFGEKIGVWAWEGWIYEAGEHGMCKRLAGYS